MDESYSINCAKERAGTLQSARPYNQRKYALDILAVLGSGFG